MDTTLEPFTGGPYNNRFKPYPWNPPHAFSSVKEYLDYYRSLFLDFCGEKYVNVLFSRFPTDTKVYLTHGDLLPRNIMVEGSTVTGIIDWENAGYYPEFWEYCRMHDLELVMPAWVRVLAHIFQVLVERMKLNLYIKSFIVSATSGPCHYQIQLLLTWHPSAARSHCNLSPNHLNPLLSRPTTPNSHPFYPPLSPRAPHPSPDYGHYLPRPSSMTL